MFIITHPLILVRFYWLLRYLEKTHGSYHAITPTCVDICPSIVSMKKKHIQHKSFKFSVLIFYMEGNQTCFVEYSNSDIKKLVTNAVLASTKKSK